MSLLTCRKIAVLDSIILTLQLRRLNGAHFTSSEKASSVPGRTHTAVVRSSGEANPRVPVLKLTVLSLSPTLAGRDSPAGLDMDSTVRTLVVISLFAALCAIVAFLLDQVFVAAIFAAELATALVEAIRRSR